MTPARLKLGAIVVGVALSALTLLSWTQVWFDIRLQTGQSIAVSGDIAAPALTALALASLASAAALTIAGVVFRVILGILQAAIGALVVLSAALAMANPVLASEPTISAATGVAGSESLQLLVSEVASTGWPLFAALFGVLLVLAGVFVVSTARLWPNSSRKYQAVRFDATEDSPTSAGDWDALSSGRDPT